MRFFKLLKDFFVRKILFIVLTLSFCVLNYGQNLYLKVNGETENDTSFLNSLLTNDVYDNFNALQKGLNAIEATLNKNGFINSHISHLKKINDSTYECQFNLKTKVEKITLLYSPSEIDNSLIKRITKKSTPNSFTISLNELEQTLNFLNTRLSENGRPFSQLELKNITYKKPSILTATLSPTSEDKKRFVNDIVIKGYEKFPVAFLKHYLRIRKNTVFNLNQIKKKTSSLKSLRFANEIKPPEVLFTKDSTTLYLYIKKKQNNTFDGFLGFNTDETSNKLKLNGYINLNLINNLNSGESLNITYKSNANEQRDFKSRISIPYLFKSPFGSELELNLFRKDSSFTTATQKAKAFYQLSQKQKVAASYKTSKSNILTNTNSALISDFQNNFYALQYNFRTITSITEFNEFNTALNFEIGKGNRKTKNANTQQYLFSLNTHKIFNLNPKNSIFVKADGKLLDSKNYIENELFLFGGINSIRGFNENSLIANTYGILNSEYRYLLSPNLYIHSISDYCYLKNNSTLQENRLYSLGFGVALKTNGNVLKFNYANGRSNGESFKFSNSKIHISLTTVF